MKLMRCTCLLLFIFLGTIVYSQVIPGYKNKALPLEARVKDLLQRMTPEEKFWQLFMIPGDLKDTIPGQYRNGIFGLQVSANAADENAARQMIGYNTSEEKAALIRKMNSIQRFFVEQTRLGIPVIFFDEALHGLVRKGATAFPQSIALAATFDTALMADVAAAIATEAKQYGIRQVLSPVINIANDVRWGRVEETYGEDPYLTSLMTLAYVHAFESRGIITTPKHFLANTGDGGRDSYPIHFNERLLKEIYLPPFKAAIHAGAGSMMTSYNSLDGSPATANAWLMQQWLRRENNFNGFVISDAGAVGGANVLHYTAADYADATAQAINNGLDVIFQTSYDHYRLFIPPFLDGRISRQRIDEAVTRVLTAKFRLGLFDQPYISESPSANNDTAHHSLARTAAAKSFVLLRNKQQTLPLNTSRLKKILVLGADATEARLGGYSGTGNQVVNITAGLKKALPTNVVLQYQKGVDREDTNWQVFPAKYLFTDQQHTQHGLKGAYYRNISASGKPDAERTDAQIDFRWTLYGPDNLGVNEFYSIEWNGYIRVDSTAVYPLAIEGNDGYRLYINNKLVADRWSKQTYHRTAFHYRFEKGRSYQVRLQFYEPTGNGIIQLLYGTHHSSQQQKAIESAVAAAKQADVVIIAAGITEGEFRDRAMLQLPGQQEKLINSIAATGKPVVVLLVAGSAVQVSNWAEDVSAIMQLWYPGEAGGEAVADVLLGKINPAGRMPFSTPIHESQLPYVYHHKPTGRGDDYYNLSGQPMYPFGYGLSYTSFTYSQLEMQDSVKAGNSITIRCTVTNTGMVAGDEVVQLYCKDELASVARPVMELKSFQRVTLQPGEQKVITFVLQPEDMLMLNRNMQWVTEPGVTRIMIGASSKDIRLQGRINITE